MTEGGTSPSVVVRALTILWLPVVISPSIGFVVDIYFLLQVWAGGVDGYLSAGLAGAILVAYGIVSFYPFSWQL